MRNALIILFCCITCNSFSQSPLPEFGIFTKDDRDLTVCPFDASADAVVIFDQATSNYNDDYYLITERRVRFKILKESGIRKGDISIPYYSSKGFERIESIAAVSMGPDGQYSELDKKGIYDRSLNRLYSQVTFAMPNVKVGTVIEYKYRSIQKSYSGLNEWVFQKEMPVMLSSYNLFIFPNAEFAYTVRKKSNYKILIVPNPKTGSTLFEMRNIAGLRDEPYSTSSNDYLQKVDFQFSGYRDSYGFQHKSSTTWKDMAKEMLDERSFGSQMSKNVLNDELQLLIGTASSPSEKIKRIYNYVRGNIAWDNIFSKFSDDGVKKVLDSKRGNSGDINLLLLSLLNSADIDAYPMLVSERSHGKVDTTYPYWDQFNKVVAYVELDGEVYVLDATSKLTPPQIIPYELLNTTGFVVDKKRPRFISIKSSSKQKLYNINLEGFIESSGTMKTEAQVNYYDYSRIYRTASYASAKEKYQDEYVKDIPLKVDSFSVEGIEADSLPLMHFLRGDYTLQQSGSYYLLNYNFFTGLEKNPFISDNRFTKIDFGCPSLCTLQGKFVIPENFTPDILPKSTMLKSNDGGLSVLRQVEKKGNVINVAIKLDLNRTEFSSEEYGALKDFYSKMVELLNEPIVLIAK